MCQTHLQLPLGLIGLMPGVHPVLLLGLVPVMQQKPQHLWVKLVLATMKTTTIMMILIIVSACPTSFKLTIKSLSTEIDSPVTKKLATIYGHPRYGWKNTISQTIVISLYQNAMQTFGILNCRYKFSADPKHFCKVSDSCVDSTRYIIDTKLKG